MSRLSKRRVVLGACLAAFAGMGCDPATLWFLNGGANAKDPAEYALPPKDGKREITVALLASSAPTVVSEFPGVHRELAVILGKKLAAETKGEKHPIKVVDPAKIDKFQAAHPDWKVLPPGTIAKQVGADYLFDLTITGLSLYDANFGHEAFSGRATVNVAIYDAATPDAPVKDYIHTTTPLAKGGDAQAGQYRQFLLDRLATELAYRHVAHMPERQLGPLK